MPEPVRLVVFDWGGVLLRICRGFAEGCAAAGIEYREGVGDDDLYQTRVSISARYQIGEITGEEFHATVARSTGGLYSAQEIERIHHAWLLGEYAGAGGLIDDLHAIDGLETGLLSNTNAGHWVRRDRDFPAAGRLHHQHASHLLRLIKPDAAIYRAFETATGHRGEAVLFFDDLAENVESARAVGWRAETIDHAGDTIAQIRSHLRSHGVM